MKCQISPLYSKDDNDNLQFYCEYCEEKINYNEERECKSNPDLCTCGAKLGTSNYSVSTCFNCNKKI